MRRFASFLSGSILLFHSLLVIYAQPTEIPQNDLLQMAKESIEDCYEDEANTVKVEITDEGFAALMEGSRNAPRNTKCIRYCIMRKNHLINAEHHLDATELTQFFANLKNEELDEKSIKQVVDHCNGAVNKAETDGCERAHLAAMCMLEQFGAESSEEESA